MGEGLRFYQPRSTGNGFGGRSFLFYVFTKLVLFGTAGPFGDIGFEFYVFTGLTTIPTTSGGHIFLDLKKDMEERQTKGLQSRPLETCFDTGERRGDVRTFLRIRRNAINAI